MIKFMRSVARIQSSDVGCYGQSTEYLVLRTPSYLNQVRILVVNSISYPTLVSNHMLGVTLFG